MQANTVFYNQNQRLKEIYCLLIILCFHLFDGESICVTKYRVGEWHSIALCITMSELPTMVFCYQNCSDLLWEKIVLVIKKNFFKIFEITRTIYSNSEWSEQFVVTECFLLTCFWRFLRSNKLEQLEFKLEKLLGFKNMQEKLEKSRFQIRSHSFKTNYQRERLAR